MPDHRDIAKARPALELPVRNAVLVRDFEFLDAVVVPFVAFQNRSVRVNPDGSLFDTIYVPIQDLLFSSLDCTAGEIA